MLSVYSRNFYSDDRSLAEAVGIPLDDEKQMTGIDLSMSQTKGYCVTASLPDLLVKGGEKLIASIAESGSHTELSLGTGVIHATNHFYFCGVPSGDYALDAVVSLSERTTSWVGVCDRR